MPPVLGSPTRIRDAVKTVKPTECYCFHSDNCREVWVLNGIGATAILTGLLSGQEVMLGATQFMYISGFVAGRCLDL